MEKYWKIRIRREVELMGRNESEPSEPKIIVTPIKKAKKYQKKAVHQKSKLNSLKPNFPFTYTSKKTIPV